MAEPEEIGSFIYSADLDRVTAADYKPKTQYRFGLAGDKYDVEFQRKDVKDAIHIITSEIKRKGTKTPYLLLPFRPQQHEPALKSFLNDIFDNGKVADPEIIRAEVKQVSPYVLISALKFFWCRLPGNCVIGWKTYTKFVTLDEEAGFPKRAFLEFMPSCLSSGAHASIVYDFFDLIVALILNSKHNMLSAKKVARLCGLWAFHPVKNKQSESPSFERGMYEWIPAGDATFHLLLSFLNSMPPKGQIEKLPKSLQHILKSTPYPPPATTTSSSSSRFLQEVPMVTIKVNNPSKNPAELLVRVSKTLKFNDPTVFYTREDYLLLKRLFKDVDGLISKLSSEGSRLLDNMCIYDEDMISDGTAGSKLAYKLIPGWSADMTSPKPVELRDADYFTATVSRATIDDYFIWTWLASLGSEETSAKKKMFGKTYIMEVELAEGFKKWVIVEEQDIERDGYDIEIELKREKLKDLQDKIREAEKEVEKMKVANRTRVVSESKDLNDITNKMSEPLPSKPYQTSPLPPPPVPEKDFPSTPDGKENGSPNPPNERGVKANSGSSYYTAVQTPSPVKDDKKPPPMRPISEQSHEVDSSGYLLPPPTSLPENKAARTNNRLPPPQHDYFAPQPQQTYHKEQPANVLQNPPSSFNQKPLPPVKQKVVPGSFSHQTLAPTSVNLSPEATVSATSISPSLAPMAASSPASVSVSSFEPPKMQQQKRNSKIFDDIESLESELMDVLKDDEEPAVSAESSPEKRTPLSPPVQTHAPVQTARPSVPNQAMQRYSHHGAPSMGYGINAPHPAYASSAPRSRSSSPLRYGQSSSPSPEHVAQSPYGSPSLEQRGRMPPPMQAVQPMPMNYYPQYPKYRAYPAPPPGGYAVPHGAPYGGYPPPNGYAAAPVPPQGYAPVPAYGGGHYAPAPVGLAPRHKNKNLNTNKTQARNALMKGDFGI
ncbi:hypothetical protein KL942_000891 [Ogataea angusta]|uniref:Meiotically up-regulated protein Msb1/Mug8 domain-containing protein n=1 Tax=Pichia angusta TaxID=870730 RepID=A0ABQ7S230_PICAN|nr:hypothetical protein KL942_000891 [Ogataea angusta]KAG7852052.1 hypothetical protein KL940_000934 [Ogataea angusta]